MAAWRGRWQNFAVYWGWRNEGRHQSRAAGAVVRHAVEVDLSSARCEMKNARPSNAESSAPNSANCTPGRLPARQNTLTAEVLRRLLDGERLTSLDAVRGASTTRLSAVVFVLETDYGWSIERTEKAAGCADGRVSWISEYWLATTTAEQAMREGAAVWCHAVRKARAELRKQAAHAEREAARRNEAARLRKAVDPRQNDLFAGWG